jgi:hypothetical protein
MISSKSVLLLVILNCNLTILTTTLSSLSSIVKTNVIPLEKFTESTSTAPMKEMTDDELIKQIQVSCQIYYVEYKHLIDHCKQKWSHPQITVLHF